MNKNRILIASLGMLTMSAQAAVYTESDINPGPVSIDGGSASFTVEVNSGPGETITGVTIELVFGKSGETCSNFIGNGFGSELAYTLKSPGDTTIGLIENGANDAGTGNGATYVAIAGAPPGTTVALDDAAGAVVGSTNAPESGSFSPEQALSTFNGEDPAGTWTLTGFDEAALDPLCHELFSLTVTTAVGTMPLARAIPANPLWSLAALSGLLGLVGFRRAGSLFRRKK